MILIAQATSDVEVGEQQVGTDVGRRSRGLIHWYLPGGTEEIQENLSYDIKSLDLYLNPRLPEKDPRDHEVC
jgi:hypothetical protein